MSDVAKEVKNTAEGHAEAVTKRRRKKRGMPDAPVSLERIPAILAGNRSRGGGLESKAFSHASSHFEAD